MHEQATLDTRIARANLRAACALRDHDTPTARHWWTEADQLAAQRDRADAFDILKGSPDHG